MEPSKSENRSTIPHNQLYLAAEEPKRSLIFVAVYERKTSIFMRECAILECSFVLSHWLEWESCEKEQGVNMLHVGIFIVRDAGRIFRSESDASHLKLSSGSHFLCVFKKLAASSHQQDA
jgi:hypothetical protein